mgnify:CR=1 FL=1
MAERDLAEKVAILAGSRGWDEDSRLNPEDEEEEEVMVR